MPDACSRRRDKVKAHLAQRDIQIGKLYQYHTFIVVRRGPLDEIIVNPLVIADESQPFPIGVQRGVPAFFAEEHRIPALITIAVVVRHFG